MPPSKVQEIPNASFTTAYTDNHGRRLPQCIAHRGSSATHPENTLSAFHAAVEADAHALEMDVQTTSDSIVVISHDPTLSLFGYPSKKIADLSWVELQEMRTIAAPHEPMPKLLDVLEFLLKPGLEGIWVLLEVKVSADPEHILKLVGETFQSFPTPASAKPWNERIVIEVLPASYIKLVTTHLPGFPIAHCSFSRSYMRGLFPVPNLAFAVGFSLLVLPGGSRLLSEAQKKHERPLWVWTVNEEETMRWCVRRGVDGVLCDDPRKFMEVCRGMDLQVKEPWFPLGWRVYWEAVKMLWLFKKRAWKAKKVLKQV